MAIKKIAHLADIHFPKSIIRHDEYKQVINNLIISLRQQKPDRIVIVGDLFNDYVKIEGELLILASRFINALAKIAPVIITRGNHDILKSAPNRVDSIQALTETMNNPNVFYYNKTGMFDDDNVVWCVWKHGEKNNNPWPKNFIKDPNKIYIDLFHDPVNGCSNSDGFTFNSKTYRSINDFIGDYSYFGDIHQKQYFVEKTKAYSSSLLALNYAEGDNQFHGYLLWDIINNTVDEMPIVNQYGFHTVNVNRFTNFDDLNITIPNISEYPRIRVKWQTLPASRTVENERKVLKYLQENFSPISIKHKNEFVENTKMDIDNTTLTDNITKRDTLHVIFKEYLEKLGVDVDIINEVLNVDIEIENRLEIEPITNIQWSIIKFKGKNFRNLKSLDVDWRNHDGIYQITGKNTAGKSSIIQFLSYVLYGKTIETDSRKKFGDARFVNNLNGATSCDGEIVISSNGEYYGVKRITTLKRNKEGELIGAPTVVSYYTLSSADDAFDSSTSIERLDDDTKHRTQKRVEEIIGTYDNFIRIILTTADTLNRALDTDNSVFIDSIMADAGLNIFDLRLTEFKKYLKELKQDRISCNVELEENAIQLMESKNYENDKNINSEKTSLKLIEESYKKDLELKTSTLKTLHKIDREIESLDLKSVNKQIEAYNKEIISVELEEKDTITRINKLASTFDEVELERLIKSKEDHKANEFSLRTKINNIKFNRNNIETDWIRNNGDIELIKRDGKSIKDEITKLKNSKICPFCGQDVTEDSQNHITDQIDKLIKKAFVLGNQIKEKEKRGVELFVALEYEKEKIVDIEKIIAKNDIDYEPNLLKIADLTNQKLEAQKRKELSDSLKNYPLRLENINLKVATLIEKLEKHKLMEKQINENSEIMVQINVIDERINEFETMKGVYLENISNMKADIEYNNKLILKKRETIVKFKEQEKLDMVHEIYEKCVHRDGVPTQILSGILLPKINNSLSNLLQSVDFTVWLDPLDLRLKMSYSTHPNSIVDCISGSGKERTFSSISLKVALNEINNKSKPTILMLDEVMGKLKDESIDEFISFLSVIKTKVNKLIVIEQNHELNPDYIINAVKDNNKVTTITFEP